VDKHCRRHCGMRSFNATGRAQTTCNVAPDVLKQARPGPARHAVAVIRVRFAIAPVCGVLSLCGFTACQPAGRRVRSLRDPNTGTPSSPRRLPTPCRRRCFSFRRDFQLWQLASASLCQPLGGAQQHMWGATECAERRSAEMNRPHTKIDCGRTSHVFSSS